MQCHNAQDKHVGDLVVSMNRRYTHGERFEIRLGDTEPPDYSNPNWMGMSVKESTILLPVRAIRFSLKLDMMRIGGAVDRSDLAGSRAAIIDAAYQLYPKQMADIGTRRDQIVITQDPFRNDYTLEFTYNVFHLDEENEEIVFDLPEFTPV